MQSAYRVPTSTHSGLLIPFRNNRSRGEPRAALRRLCLVRADSSADEAPIEVQGEMVNLSRTGLALQLAAALPVGIDVRIELSLGDETFKSLDGRIVHCRRVATGTYEVGVSLLPHVSAGATVQRHC